MIKKTRFSIIQLSDLHLTKDDNDVRSEVALLGRLSGMNCTFRRLMKRHAVKGADLILVTGDVTDRGNLEAWRVFKTSLASEGLTKNSLVLPGNHDVCNLGIRRPGWRKERIENDLRKVRAGLKLVGQNPKFPWAKKVSRDIVIFGIDSCNLGNLSAVTNAVGQIGWEQLETFARLLLKYKSAKIKIVALHHSPNIPGRHKEEERGLEPMGKIERWGSEVPSRDRQALRLLCVSHGVRLIVHGHLHRDEDRRVNGIRIIGAPASTEPTLIGKQKCVQIRRYVVNGARSRLTTKLLSIPIA